MKKRLAILGSTGSVGANTLDVAARHPLVWRVTSPRSAMGELDLGRTIAINLADLREELSHGQVVAGYTLQGSTGGEWRTLARGSTIGFRKLDRFAAADVRRVRLIIDRTVAAPRPVHLALHAAMSGESHGG